ncbi:hypothetical protein KSF_093380 [Reticulibacter mediterranei]|uniref:Uncharacterized protein n=1 Tax=Reticulibacter mediterranei TaxID=2778369 RepID=A0A8J3IVK6_9CHLR|nr:hypothetical protein [Reticulibacter mediterranei]GHO99290.1 hypothetical protein KSF_093380 [Reticulibacter mediterranei]
MKKLSTFRVPGFCAEAALSRREKTARQMATGQQKAIQAGGIVVPQALSPTACASLNASCRAGDDYACSFYQSGCP